MSLQKEVQGLSTQAKALWGKSDYGTGELWLPLYLHMVDSCGMATRLWDGWLSDGVKDTLARPFEGDKELAKRVVVFLATTHDLGKATPIFQAKGLKYGNPDASLAWIPEHAGLPLRRDLAHRSNPTHPIAGEYLLERELIGRGWSKHTARSYASVIGSHHGRFPSRDKVTGSHGADKEPVAMGLSDGEDGPWPRVQGELIRFCEHISGMDASTSSRLSCTELPIPVACLITGIVIMTDWMASDQEYFPLLPTIDEATGPEGAEQYCGREEQNSYLGGIDDSAKWHSSIDINGREGRAWDSLSIAPAWHESASEAEKDASDINAFFRQRFSLPNGARPRPVQVEALRIALQTTDPGIMVIEAPMGEGKTEAALMAAEILVARTGLGGVCVALPTMATTDAMFSRVESWLRHLPQDDGVTEKSIYLAHGKAQLNEQFQGIVQRSRGYRSSSMGIDLDEGDSSRDFAKRRNEEIIASDWMFGRKKGMLANFTVCTVDQVLMAALDMKHLPLRQLAVEDKVVIIDECHAYDLYMRQYLNRVLQWLGYWHTPVILLSATLPVDQRNQMVEYYLEGKRCSERPFKKQGPGCDSDSLASPAQESALPVQKKSVPAWKRSALARRKAASANGDITPNTAPKGSCQGALFNGECCHDLEAYPLITYSDGTDSRSAKTQPSGRSVNVQVECIDDSAQTLCQRLSSFLEEGGCAGVICDTVSRAQEAAAALSQTFGADIVLLDHSRFMDIDRMRNEQQLRDLLGPAATVRNGARPRRLIVVGTQVLEQSLDIDFDVLITDVAPIDLLMQRLGRTHRHHRGDCESDRPAALREAKCLVRGVDLWNDDGPRFAKGVSTVYPAATLLEGLSVLGITFATSQALVQLPKDISVLVRTAYSPLVQQKVPDAWMQRYSEALGSRGRKQQEQKSRAESCLLMGIGDLAGGYQSLTALNAQDRTNELQIGDLDAGPRAVRDTQETIEVILVRKTADGGIALFPWIGGKSIETGAELPTDEAPDPQESKLLLQCTTRLPLSICPMNELDDCIEELERGCGRYVEMWQESPWLAGMLVLPLEEVRKDIYQTTLLGKTVQYTRHGGLATVQ